LSKAVTNSKYYFDLAVKFAILHALIKAEAMNQQTDIIKSMNPEPLP